MGKRSGLGGLVAIAVALCVFVGGGAAAAFKVPTQVVDLAFNDNETPGGDLSDSFTGRVTSSGGLCVPGRMVKIMRKKASGELVLIGKTTTDTNGYFMVLVEDPKDGIYVAIATQKRLSSDEYCEPGRSKITITNTSV